MNSMRDKLQAGEVAIGAAGSADGEARLLAGAGFDFLIFDTQHTTMEIKQLSAPIASMRGRPAIPVVRVGSNSAEQICNALDAGAKGIIVPMVESRTEAEAMVAACKYPPIGLRSNAGMRGRWGEFKNYRDYMDAVNEQVLIAPMVETVAGLNKLEDIVTTPGVNALLIGPSDLSIALDMPLDYTNPKYHAALDEVADTCLSHGVAPGMYFVPPGIEPRELINKGFQFFLMEWQEWAKSGIESGLASIR